MLHARIFGGNDVIQIQKDFGSTHSKNALNIQHMGKDRAMEYAKLFASAPKLFTALKIAAQYIDITDEYEEIEIDGEMIDRSDIIDIVENAIKLATE